MQRGTCFLVRVFDLCRQDYGAGKQISLVPFDWRRASVCRESEEGEGASSAECRQVHDLNVVPVKP